MTVERFRYGQFAWIRIGDAPGGCRRRYTMQGQKLHRRWCVEKVQQEQPMHLHSTFRRRRVKNLRPWLFAFAGGGRGGKDDDHHGPRRRGRGGGVRDRNRILIATPRLRLHPAPVAVWHLLRKRNHTTCMASSPSLDLLPWWSSTRLQGRRRGAPVDVALLFALSARSSASALELTNPVAAGLGRERGEDEESV